MKEMFEKLAAGTLNRIETPDEVLKLFGVTNLSHLIECADTVSADQIRRSVQASSLGTLEDKRLYYPLAVAVDDCGIDESSEDSETYQLIVYFLTQVQKVITQVLRGQGNTVYATSPIKKNGFKEGKNGNGWLQPHGYNNLVIKELNGNNFQQFYSPFTLPEHQNLVRERYKIAVGDKGSKKLLVFAPDLSDIPDFHEVSLNEMQALRVLVDSMRGCMHLHSQDLVHRDIKPENILVFENSEGPIGKLCDHEMLAPQGALYKKDTRGRVYAAGTTDYMDIVYYPSYREQDKREISAQSDVFAFGITLLEFYLRDLMRDFVKEFQVSECQNIDEARIVEFLEAKNSEIVIPEIILSLIVKMLRYDRTKRPRLASVIKILEKYLAKLTKRR